MIDSVNRKSRSQLDTHEPSIELAEPSPGELEAHRKRLVLQILRRIESRLPGRVRQLSVCAVENEIVLSGQCNTYYTKQVAQHTAMGVLEYERLINNIDVYAPK